MFLPSGAVLTIDGSTGRLFLDDRVAAQAATQPFIETLLEWARVSEARTYAEGSTKFAVADASSLDCLGLLRAIQLRGVASLQSLSEMLICPTETIAKAIEALGPLPIETMKAGVRLSAEGRRMLDDSLQVERSVADRTALNDIIVRFEPLDAAFKQLVTDWQLRPSSGGGGEEEAARNLASLVQSLDRIHTPIMRIVVEAALHAPRLARINHRLAHARDRIGAGDLAMLASPIRDSYHSIWFELHEELLHLSGRTRRDLEAAASG
jgi:pyruvate,orthophosphate dikinase